MQSLLDKITQFRAIADLVGFIIGGIILLIVLGWFIYQIMETKKGEK